MDCYSLGVMLFVMLVGSKPMSQDQVQGMKYAWMQPEQLRNMHVRSPELLLHSFLMMPVLQDSFCYVGIRLIVKSGFIGCRNHNGRCCQTQPGTSCFPCYNQTLSAELLSSWHSTTGGSRVQGRILFWMVLSWKAGLTLGTSCPHPGWQVGFTPTCNVRLSRTYVVCMNYSNMELPLRSF